MPRASRLTVSRLIAAVLGGYAFTYAATAALAVMLPLAKADAVLTASMLSFAVYMAVILWSFAARNLRRVWLWLAAATVALAAIGFSPLWRGML